MSDTKHTPGPWKAHLTLLERSGSPEYQIHWSDIGECVAEVVHGTANARLIAAAPELLEALMNLMLEIETKAWGIKSPSQYETAAFVAARAVIAKAEGHTT